MAPLPADDCELALGLDCRVLALGVDCLVLALGVDCRLPDGPVGLNPELPDERGVVEADRFGVEPDERADDCRFCAADSR